MAVISGIDLADIVPNKTGGRQAGAPKEIIPVFDEYKAKAIESLKLSLEEAKGRFDSGLKRPEYTPSSNWRIVGGSEANKDTAVADLAVMVCIKVGKRNKLKCMPEFKTVNGEVQQVADTGAAELKVKGAAVSKILANLLAQVEGMSKDDGLGKMFHEEAIALGKKARKNSIAAGKIKYDAASDKFIAA